MSKETVRLRHTASTLISSTSSIATGEAPLIELFEPSSSANPRHCSPTRRQSWTDDSLVRRCIACRRSFNFFLRRHHCRRCGQILCGACSNNRLAKIRDADDRNYHRLW